MASVAGRSGRPSPSRWPHGGWPPGAGSRPACTPRRTSSTPGPSWPTSPPKGSCSTFGSSPQTAERRTPGRGGYPVCPPWSPRRARSQRKGGGMRVRSVGWVAIAVGLFLTATTVPGALAAPDHTLTIEAPSGALVTYGDPVHITGKLTPGAVGETVRLRDPNARVLAAVKTAQFGKFSFDYVPHDTVYVHAEWDGMRSNAIQVKARPRVTAAISGVLLFGTATVSGSVVPWDQGAAVAVTVLHNGAKMLQRNVRLGSSSSFR